MLVGGVVVVHLGGVVHGALDDLGHRRLHAHLHVVAHPRGGSDGAVHLPTQLSRLGSHPLDDRTDIAFRIVEQSLEQMDRPQSACLGVSGDAHRGLQSLSCGN